MNSRNVNEIYIKKTRVEAVERLNVITDKTIDLPSSFDAEKDEPRFAADVWNGLVESRSSRLSKISVSTCLVIV